MRSRSLEVGLDSISYWRVGDDDHLPVHGKSAPGFHARYRELDEILRRPSLDERLTDLIQPASLDQELLEPSVLSGARRDARQFLQAAAENASGQGQAALQKAADILAEEVRFDHEVRAALASLVKG